MKSVKIRNKEHDKSFIWYYYAYDIWNAILDLDPDLCQNYPFFVGLPLSIHIQFYELYSSISYFCKTSRYPWRFKIRSRFKNSLWWKSTQILLTLCRKRSTRYLQLLSSIAFFLLLLPINIKHGPCENGQLVQRAKVLGAHPPCSLFINYEWHTCKFETHWNGILFLLFE